MKLLRKWGNNISNSTGECTRFVSQGFFKKLKARHLQLTTFQKSTELGTITAGSEQRDCFAAAGNSRYYSCFRCCWWYQRCTTTTIARDCWFCVVSAFIIERQKKKKQTYSFNLSPQFVDMCCNTAAFSKQGDAGGGSVCSVEQCWYEIGCGCLHTWNPWR